MRALDVVMVKQRTIVVFRSGDFRVMRNCTFLVDFHMQGGTFVVLWHICCAMAMKSI